MIKKMKNLMTKKAKKKVFSIEHGVGEVLGRLKLHDGVEDYLEIKFANLDYISLLPVSEKEQVRTVSNMMELKFNLRELGRKINSEDIQDKSFRNDDSLKLSMRFVINTIARLSNNKFLSINEKKVLSQCVNSLILEVSYVYKVNEISARSIVSDYMRCA